MGKTFGSYSVIQIRTTRMTRFEPGLMTAYMCLDVCIYDKNYV
ncbi:hypothetical protein HanPSC8_Chr02g0062441 [Helianthus annuus]|nr:hypothetical protein HanPSC8_Chr02g0062441 [Helianthus annuus]